MKVRALLIILLCDSTLSVLFCAALQSFYQKKTPQRANEDGTTVEINTQKEYDAAEIFSVAREISKERKFKESFEVIVKLNVDPTQGDQNVRGTCILPSGTGKEVRVCVFAGEEFHEDLKSQGADVLGDENTLKDMGEGVINFDKIIATPEHMPSLKQLARILGPKGLMPNVKSGTLVKQHELLETVK